MANSEPTKALNLELPAQQSFIRYFNSLPEKPPSTVRFYNRVDYYTVHGDDATLASDFLSLRLKYMGDQPKLTYICLNKAHFETLVRELLLVRQYRVEVYLKNSQNKNNDWALEYKGSPGNLSSFEELLFENSNIDFTNTVMGVKLGQNKNLAICCVNITEAKFEVSEIVDNESFSELEAILAQIGPRECVIPAGESPDLVSLRTLLERNGILTAKVKRSDFSLGEIYQDLNRLLFFREEQQRNSATYTETNLKEAMGCLQAVIKFLNLTGDPSNFNQFKLGTLEASRYVRLDNAALYALNVLPKIRSHISQTAGLNQTATKNSSLKGLLDCCVTSQGHRLLEQWIKQPLKDYNLINDRLEIVETFVKDAETRTLLVKECLPRLADLMLLSKKVSCRKANLQDCYRVYQTMCNLPRMVQFLRDTRNKCVIASLVDPMSEFISDMQNYQNMIDQTLDLDLIDRGEYLIKASFDNDLNEFHRKKEKLGEKMQHELAAVADDLGLEEGKSIKLECNDQHGYFFRITLKEERTLRKQKNYTILDAIKGGVRFRNEMLTKLNEKYAAINEEYKERQKTIVEEILEVACGYAECLRNLSHLIATVDVLTSFAVAAISARIPYVRPKLHQEGTGILDLKKVRHPCLEAQDNVSFIPNDASFHKNTDTLHIITGPNMCGKSTYIRSIGTCVLMAHIGSFVPCAKAEISIIDGILVRVGAEDCQLKGLSTFMLEMIETSSIMKCASQNSLVIIDELGRGTSTYDGCGIAWAIAEHLVKVIKCFSLFATHYHEITRLAEMYDTVSNLHVTAATTDDTIIPLYQIQKGECDKSYGVHCAKMVGFPEDMIKDAIEYQKKLEHGNGMKYITDFQSDIKRKIVAEGDAIIKETISKMKSVNVDKMSDSELSNLLTELKSDVLSKDNLFIKGLIYPE